MEHKDKPEPIEWTKKVRINPSNDTDRQVLELRCATLWLELVDGDLKSRHKVLYHRCCTSFSKVKAEKNMRHPKEDTASLAWLIKEQRMKNSSDLAEYLAAELKGKPECLQVLPRLNYVHQSDLDYEELLKPLDEERLFTVQYEHQVAWEGQEE